jgi:LysM repeat protein
VIDRAYAVVRALVIVVALALAGCGPLTRSDVATELTIETRTGPSVSALRLSRATLHCDGTARATGFLRHAAGPACGLVRRGVLQRVATNQRVPQPCSQAHGVPQWAHIAGTIQGRRITLTVTRTNGCGTADWQALEPILFRPQRGSRATPIPTTTTTIAPPFTYQVKRGDTLTAIAKRFRIPITTIVALNHLTDPDHLVEGQPLVIPSVPPVQIVITPAEAQAGAAFVIKLTGAKPSETVTFEIDAPDGKFTGPPHQASDDGVVTATYHSADATAGTYTVVAKGNQGTVAQASFRVDPFSPSPTATTPY